MKFTVLLAFSFIIISIVQAQKATPNPTNGRKIIMLHNGYQFVGNIIKSGPDSLTVKNSAGERTIALADILRINDDEIQKAAARKPKSDLENAEPPLLVSYQNFYSETIPQFTTIHIYSNVATGASLFINGADGLYLRGNVDLLPVANLTNDFSNPTVEISFGKGFSRKQDVSLEVNATAFSSDHFKSVSFHFGIKNHRGPLFFGLKSGAGYSTFSIFRNDFYSGSTKLGADTQPFVTFSGTMMYRVNENVHFFSDQTASTIPNWSTHFFTWNTGILISTDRFKFRPGLGLITFKGPETKSLSFLTPRLEIGFSF